MRRQQAAEQQFPMCARCSTFAGADKAFSGLSQLSSSITQYAEQGEMSTKRKEMQRGMALAYTNGVSR